jgi:uncharacterized membrane protein
MEVAMHLGSLISQMGEYVDLLGVVVILPGIAVSSVTFAHRLIGRVPFNTAYRAYRRNLGRGLLLGLEILVAGDIIRTVAVAPTLENAIVLGIIVLIRTFLGWALEVEVNGRFPWQGRSDTGSAAVSHDCAL